MISKQLINHALDSRYDWDAATTMGFLKNYGLSGMDVVLHVSIILLCLIRCLHFASEIRVAVFLRKSTTSQVLIAMVSRCGNG